MVDHRRSGHLLDGATFGEQVVHRPTASAVPFGQRRCRSKPARPCHSWFQADFDLPPGLADRLEKVRPIAIVLADRLHGRGQHRDASATLNAKRGPRRRRSRSVRLKAAAFLPRRRSRSRPGEPMVSNAAIFVIGKRSPSRRGRSIGRPGPRSDQDLRRADHREPHRLLHRSRRSSSWCCASVGTRDSVRLLCVIESPGVHPHGPGSDRVDHHGVAALFCITSSSIFELIIDLDEYSPTGAAGKRRGRGGR